MANATPARYAPPSPNDSVERKLLASLSFVGRKQAEFCLDAANSIERVRSELNRVYQSANEMPLLNAKILGTAPAAALRAAATSATNASHVPAVDAQAAQARAEQRSEIDRAFGVGRWASDAAQSTTYNPRTCVQEFGAR